MGTHNILIADDDQDSRNLLSEVLQANGYSVVAVADGVAAREELNRDGAFHVVIADLRMPRESGLDLLRNLRKQKSSQPLVLMSSFISDTERQVAHDLGAQALLDKPFRLAELLKVVDEVVHQKAIPIAPLPH